MTTPITPPSETETPRTDAEEWWCPDCGTKERHNGPQTTNVVSSTQCKAQLAEKETQLQYANDAATKGDLARLQAGGMEMQIAELTAQNAQIFTALKSIEYGDDAGYCPECQFHRDNKQRHDEFCSIGKALSSTPATSLEDLKKRILESVVATLSNLVKKIEWVHDQPQYLAVWHMCQIHGGDYSKGPSYEKEFKEAQALLSTLNPTQKVETNNED